MLVVRNNQQPIPINNIDGVAAAKNGDISTTVTIGAMTVFVIQKVKPIKTPVNNLNPEEDERRGPNAKGTARNIITKAPTG